MTAIANSARNHDGCGRFRWLSGIRDSSRKRAAPRHHAKRAPFALALLLSLAVHSAAITSLEHFAAPLGASKLPRNTHSAISARLLPAEAPLPQQATPAAAPTPAATEQPEPDPPGDAGTATPGMPIATYFYAKNEVDRPATAISDVVLRYPREAFAAGVHGTVILEVFVELDGSVARTRVVEALPRGIFEEAAREAVSQLRYRPAQKGHATVRSRRLVQVVFDPDPPLLPPQATFATGRQSAGSERRRDELPVARQ